MSENLGLHGKSLTLATQKPPGWEYLLFAQVILDEVEKANLALSQAVESTSSHEGSAVSLLGFHRWYDTRMEEIWSLTGETAGLMDSINSQLESVFLALGHPGNIPAIVLLSRQIASFCERIVQWATIISGTPVDPLWREPTRELTAFAQTMIQSVERFANDITEQIENHPNSQQGMVEQRAFHLTIRGSADMGVCDLDLRICHLPLPLSQRTEQLQQQLMASMDQYVSALSDNNEENIERCRRRVEEEKAILKVLNELGSEANLVTTILALDRCAARVSAANTNDVQYPEAGYIYLMVNPSMEGLVKIGKTARDPMDRVNELGAATGVPTPFILVFQAYVSDCSKAEKYIHSCLEKRNYRVSRNREFFRVPTTEAIEIMLQAKARFAISAELQKLRE